MKISIVIPELQWDWEKPKIRMGTFGHETMDPFPGYGHDPVLTKKIAYQVAVAFPLDIPVTFYLPTNETVTRTNGWTDFERGWNEKTRKHFLQEGRIVLSGKRIPIHPAMTRYLVAHEYGHVVEAMLEQIRNIEYLRNEYGEMRKLPPRPKYYGGGVWHISSGEVFANDFRILVCGVEKEYWPHPGIQRPEQSKYAISFWKKAKKELQYRNT